MKSIFVTGTGTGVGKTVVACALSAYFSIRRGLNVGVMKPVETGWDPDFSDGLMLKKASGSEDVIDDIVPYRFRLPAAPEVAATYELREIDLGILTNVYQKLLSRHDLLIVEGAGGILVPIKDGFFFSDLARIWNMYTLVISENKLGTINHTLLTCHYLLSQNIKVLGVILNNKEQNPDPSSESNPSILKKYLPVPLLGVFPSVRLFYEDPSFRESLAEVLEKSIDSGFFSLDLFVS
ncbi:MAG: dethiobiotin synthase [Deltaproteobacteria bacterium]|nr:dethiobiotin synthase [Deltaproteobacteria bacterium]